METAIDRFPIIELDETEGKKYINGIKIYKEGFLDGKYRLYIEKQLYGISIVKDGIIKSDKRISQP